MNNQSRMIHDLLSSLKDPPSAEALTVAYALDIFLQSYADDGVVDTGFGFGESHLDFWLDNKAVRVIIKRVPAEDRPNE